MVKEHASRQRSIKSKLMAAVSMLLVSTIMMVSSTYAWFTLSTAPEVTGITTAVGANGNLEMALLPTSGALSEIITGQGLTGTAANTTWGNLVDLKDTSYGLNKIVLNPSELNYAAAESANSLGQLQTGAFLKTPTYGADGRISGLAAGTLTAVADQQLSFIPKAADADPDYGVRGVGNVSGMSERELAYRNARQDADAAKSSALSLIVQSLNTRGPSLASIVLSKEAGATTFSGDDINSLKGIVTDLEKALDSIEEAYVNIILGIAASDAADEAGAMLAKYKGLATLDAMMTELASDAATYSIDISALTTAVNAYKATAAKVAQVGTDLANVPTDGTATYNDISAAMGKLADTDHMRVGNFPVSDAVNNIVEIVTSGGLVITMESGAGVYADISDHCGVINGVAVKLPEGAVVKGFAVGGLSVKMATAINTDVTPGAVYLDNMLRAVTALGAPASDSEDMPISDFYGYIIDLGFRTNAANSDLLLQIDPKDRIYGDQEGNEDTQGGGSSMTFASSDPNFSNDQVKSLMDCIRIIFFETDTGNVLAKSKLDAQNAKLTADGMEAKMYIYTGTAASGQKTYTAFTGTALDSATTYYVLEVIEDSYDALTAEEATAAKAAGTTLYTRDADGTNYTSVAADADLDDSVTYYKMIPGSTGYKSVSFARAEEIFAAKSETLYVSSTTSTETVDDESVITGLVQNEAKAISVLVYLDGNYVTNADVATAARSMEGKMNLQFASSATLVPMEYGNLHTNKVETPVTPPPAGEGTETNGTDNGTTEPTT